jgi:nucleoid DNA-binding protein
MDKMKSKPETIDTKEYIVKVTSQELQIPVDTVKAVIDHQFQGALNAMKDKDSIEITGLGKFYFYKKKALSIVKQYNIEIEKDEKNIKEGLIPECDISYVAKNIISKKKYVASIKQRIENSSKPLYNTKKELITNKRNPIIDYESE